MTAKNTTAEPATLNLFPVSGPLAVPVTSTQPAALLVRMAYETEDGREASVVFSGNEDDFDVEMRPFRNETGAVRVTYQNDGNVVYDWYTGTLTPLGWYDAPVAVQFKSEGDLDGDTVGPMRMLFAGEDPHRVRAYRHDRNTCPWVTRDHAVEVAASLGLSLQES